MKFTRFLLMAFILAGLTLSLADGQSARAATNINVTTTVDELTTNSQCSLREAITRVNGGSAPDCGILGTAPHTINIPAGTYTITIANTDEDGNLDGDFDITTTDEVILAGADAATTIIEASTVVPAHPDDPPNPGQATYRVFHVVSNANTTFSDVTVRHGNYDGGIYSAGAGVVSILNSDISHNLSAFDYISGGLHAREVIIDQSTLTHNIDASEFSGFTGGAVGAQIATISNSTLSNNETFASSFSAGALYAHELHISDSFFISNHADDSFGGAIYYNSTSLAVDTNSTIDNTTFQNNFAQSAGAVFISTNSADTPLITNSTFDTNECFAPGGGIHSVGNMHVQDSIFVDNSCTAGSAITPTSDSFAGTVLIERSDFSGGMNTPDAVHVGYDVTVTIVDSVFHDILNGGVGVANELGATVIINSSTFTEVDTAVLNWGLNTELTMINSTVAENSRVSNYAIYNYDNGTIEIINSTIAGNTLDGGEFAIYNEGDLTLTNTIVSNSTGTNCDLTAGGTGVFTDGGGNLEYPSTSCGFGGALNDSTNDPLLVALADNGGSTETMALGVGSPAINGTGAVCPAEVNGVDQRSATRDSNCDIGAFEVLGASSLVVTTPIDELTTNGQCSLREAVTLVNGGVAPDCGILGTAPHTINIPAGTYTITIGNTDEDGNLDGDFDITTADEVIFAGADVATTIIEASTVAPATWGDPPNPGQADYRLFHVLNASTNVTIDNMTLRHGGQLGNPGGAIRNEGTLLVSNSRITMNQGEFAGGGIGNGSNGVLIIQDSMLDNNVSAAGGAINNNGNMLIERSIFDGNEAVFFSQGGAIASGFGSLIITESTFQNNLGLTGAILSVDANTTITGSTFTNNGQAGSTLMFVTGGTTQIINSTFADDGNGSLAEIIVHPLGTLDLINTTLANSDTAIDIGSSGQVTITNSIIANDNRSTNCDLTDGTFIDGGGNLEYPGTSCGFGGGLNDGTNDPLLQALTDNGGSTETMVLGVGSPAINGTETTCPAEVNGVDQRGEPRDAMCDIGAFESDFVPIANDYLVNATIINSLPFNALIEPISGATVSGSDPTLFCTADTNLGSVWYTYTPATDHLLYAHTFNPDFGAGVAIFSDVASALNMTSCGTYYSDSNAASGNSVKAGVTYYIMVVTTDPLGLDITFDLNVTSLAQNDALTLFDPSNSNTSLISELTNNPVGGTDYTNTPPTNTAPEWVMGDWNGDGVKTPGYFDSGAFRYTNDIGPSTNWSSGFWLGNAPGRVAVVAGRFDSGFANDTGNDCIGWVDSNTNGAGDLRFSLKYWCDMTITPQSIGGILTPQWLAAVLSDSQGFVGTHQWVYGDWDNDNLDEPAVRRGEFITRSTNAPSEGAAIYGAGMAQRWAGIGGGIGPGGHGLDEGLFVAGDWNGDGVDTWGVVYDDDIFYYRDVFGFNPGPFEFASQTFTSSIATPRQADSHHSAGGGSSSPAPAFADGLVANETGGNADTSRNVEADLSVSKAGNYTLGEVGLVGDSIVWTITVSNTGSASANAVEITDNVPSELRVDDALADNGTIAVRGQIVTFNVESLGVGETAQFQVVTTIISQSSSGTFANSVNVLLLDGDSSGSDANLVASGTVESVDSLPATGYRPKLRW